MINPFFIIGIILFAFIFVVLLADLGASISTYGSPIKNFDIKVLSLLKKHYIIHPYDDEILMSYQNLPSVYKVNSFLFSYTIVGGGLIWRFGKKNKIMTEIWEYVRIKTKYGEFLND